MLQMQFTSGTKFCNLRVTFNFTHSKFVCFMGDMYPPKVSSSGISRVHQMYLPVAVEGVMSYSPHSLRSSLFRFLLGKWELREGSRTEVTKN